VSRTNPRPSVGWQKTGQKTQIEREIDCNCLLPAADDTFSGD
jgi:hypothetical protein